MKKAIIAAHIKKLLGWLLTAPKITIIAILITTIGVNWSSNAAIPHQVATNTIYTALGVGGFGFILSIVRTVKTEKGRPRRIKILGTIMIPIIGAAALIGNHLPIYMFNQQQEEPQQFQNFDIRQKPTQPVTQDPELLSELQYLEATYDYHKLNLIYTDNPAADCKWDLADGCYFDFQKTIKMKRNNNKTALRTILAHEYLHYAWYENHLDTDSRLVSDLIVLYGRYPEFRQRIAGVDGHYQASGGLLPTELFSYGCTEISDAKLGSYITEKCKQYININKLPALF